MPNSPFFSQTMASSPTRIINDRAAQNQSITSLSFPPDTPKYYTLLLENDWTNVLSTKVLSGLASATADSIASIFKSVFGGDTKSSSLTGNPLTMKAAYRLPLPTVIIDNHEVQYDHAFNWLGAVGNLASGIATTAGGVFGYTLNNFKYVTLQSPQFRQYAFEWHMSPNNPAESSLIRSIYLGIKRGMQPPKKSNNLVFEFPRIYWLGFYPNAGFLVKFKPAVITSCQINYQGGNPSPSFYAETGAPEGIVMRISFLELEYWHQENFANAENSADPFDTADWYKLS